MGAESARRRLSTGRCPLRTDWTVSSGNVFAITPRPMYSVIREPAGRVPTARDISCWALMDSNCLEDAREHLRAREKTNSERIGTWSRGYRPPAYIPELDDWALARNLDAVVWTALPPKFKEREGRIPTVEEVVCYLQNFLQASRRRRSATSGARRNRLTPNTGGRSERSLAGCRTAARPALRVDSRGCTGGAAMPERAKNFRF